MSLAVLDFGPLTETIQFQMEIDKLKDLRHSCWQHSKKVG